MVLRFLGVTWAMAGLSLALYFSPLGPDLPPPDPAPPQPMPATTPPPAAVVEPPPTPSPPAPGALFVLVDGSHLARLDERGWTSFPEARTGVELRRDLDGALWTATTDQTYLRLDEAGLHPRVTLDPRQSCPRFVPISAQELWAACTPDRVWQWQGDAWNEDGRPELTGSGDPPIGIDLDGAGRLWLATRDRLEVRRELGGWTALPLPTGEEILALRRGPGLSMFVLTPRFLLRYPDDFKRPLQVKLASEGEVVHERLAVSRRGDIVVVAREPLDIAATGSLPGEDYGATAFDRVALTRSRDGQTARFSEARDVGVGAPTALAIDDRGRVYWGSAAGLVILGEGPTRTWWRGAVPELASAGAGRIGALTDILVVAAGPTALPAVDESTPGVVRGRVLIRERARKGVAVQLCRTPRPRYRGSPCQDQRLHFTATTDAQGEFRLADVPPGEYRLVVQTGERWELARQRIVATLSKTPLVLAPVRL